MKKLNDEFLVGLLGELKWDKFVKRPFVAEAIQITTDSLRNRSEGGSIKLDGIMFFSPVEQESPGAYEFMVDLSPTCDVYFSMVFNDTPVLHIHSNTTVAVRTREARVWADLPHDILEDHSNPSTQEVELLDFTYPRWRKDLSSVGETIKNGLSLFDSFVGDDGHFKQGAMETY